MVTKNLKQARRQKIRYRIRKKIKGTPARPRLCLYKSNTALYAQLIDDTHGHTIAAVDSRKLEKKKDKAAAATIGQTLAAQIKEKKVPDIVYDRSGYLYHGVVKTFFDTVRENINKA